MRIIYKFLGGYALLFFLSIAPLLAQDKVAKLPDGREVLLHADGTWSYKKGVTYNYDFTALKDNAVPDFLRDGILVRRGTLVTAVEMYLQGWRYTMPVPKSSQARWGNTDGRTTWYKGYWYNKETGRYSKATPEKASNGRYYGDRQNESNQWGNGGSPPYPSKLQWLLSTYGGVRPD